MQYHKQRVSSRDKDMVSTAAQFSLPGYQAGPFSQSTVTQFLQDFSQHRTEAKKKAEAEKVRGRGGTEGEGEGGTEEEGGGRGTEGYVLVLKACHCRRVTRRRSRRCRRG